MLIRPKEVLNFPQKKPENNISPGCIKKSTSSDFFSRQRCFLAPKKGISGSRLKAHLTKLGWPWSKSTYLILFAMSEKTQSLSQCFLFCFVLFCLCKLLIVDSYCPQVWHCRGEIYCGIPTGLPEIAIAKSQACALWIFQFIFACNLLSCQMLFPCNDITMNHREDLLFRCKTNFLRDRPPNWSCGHDQRSLSLTLM